MAAISGTAGPIAGGSDPAFWFVDEDFMLIGALPEPLVNGCPLPRFLRLRPMGGPPTRQAACFILRQARAAPLRDAQVSLLIPAAFHATVSM